MVWGGGDGRFLGEGGEVKARKKFILLPNQIKFVWLSLLRDSVISESPEDLLELIKHEKLGKFG